jgi:phosphoglycolate phosphatase-like HAD superfamily hydrolase
LREEADAMRATLEAERLKEARDKVQARIDANDAARLARQRQAASDEQMREKATKKERSTRVAVKKKVEGKLVKPIEVIILHLPHCASYDGASKSYRDMVPELEAMLQRLREAGYQLGAVVDRACRLALTLLACFV